MTVPHYSTDPEQCAHWELRDGQCLLCGIDYCPRCRLEMGCDCCPGCGAPPDERCQCEPEEHYDAREAIRRVFRRRDGRCPECGTHHGSECPW